MATEKDPILARIQAAESDKQKQASWIDETMRLMLPTQRRVSDSSDPASRTAEQSDLFDVTLQIVGDDFASDMSSTFTPRYERWVHFAPSDALSEGQRREIAPELQSIGDLVFGEIERSNYFSAAQECFGHWAVSRMMVVISDRGATEPLHFQVVEIADQIVERGPDGSTSGRWRKMRVKMLDLPVLWPEHFTAPEKKDEAKVVSVYEGIDRDWSKPAEEAWNYRIIVDGKIKVGPIRYVGPGSAQFITCQFKAQADTAWGPGPAHKATPMARVLDELGYMSLKALGKSVDPVVSYEEDGLTNPEGGVNPGDWIPRAAGSKAPETMRTEVRFDYLAYNVDELRKDIRRALYQDRPEQDGKTPPTATQWNYQNVWQTRRRELPRDICVQEWVLPIIQRVAWILKQRGVLPEIKLQGGQLVNVQPVSPLSKAKDLEDVQVSERLIDLGVKLQAAVAQGFPCNPIDTFNNLKRTLGERNLVMLTQDQAVQVASATGMIQQPNGQPPA